MANLGRETTVPCGKYFDKEYLHKLMPCWVGFFEIHTTRFKSHTYIENYNVKHNKGSCDGGCGGDDARWLWGNYKIPGSLYGVSYPMSSKVSLMKYIFVLEMDNTLNKIMGIGFIRNKLTKNQNIVIYKGSENAKNNNYIYKSKYHVQLINPYVCFKLLGIGEDECKHELSRHKSNKVAKQCRQKQYNMVDEDEDGDGDMDEGGNGSNRRRNQRKSASLYEDYVSETLVRILEDFVEPSIFYGKTHLKRGGSFTGLPRRIPHHDRLLRLIIDLFVEVNPNRFVEDFLAKQVDRFEEVMKDMDRPIEYTETTLKAVVHDMDTTIVSASLSSSS
jgi:hypothetical protein